MIIPTLSLMKYLSQHNFGTMSKDLFWEKLELSANGVYIVSNGQAQELHARRVQSFTLYSRGETDISGYTQLENIVEFLNNSSDSICTLPTVRDKATKTVADPIGNVFIRPLTTITNSGKDSEGKTIWLATGQIEY